MNFPNPSERDSPQLSELDIEDFDNDIYSYSVEARKDEEATLNAEELFNSDTDTKNVNRM